MKDHAITQFRSGLITKIEDMSIPEDAASSSLNWLTLSDRIELSGGYSVIGTENGAGKITGLAVGEKADGTFLPIRTRGKKVEYYNSVTSDWVESGTNLLGTAADGEDVSITFYTSLAGYQAWLSSPNSGLFKMMLANPGSAEDQYDAAKNFKGYIYSANGRLLLWNRLYLKNYLYGSYKDVQNTVVYTTVTAEAIGAAPGPTYTGTLAAVTGKRTCFNTVFTDGTKSVQDDKNGALYGDGTGTINYTTGAYSVTFNGATVAPVTCTYQWEDSTAKGLADFTFSATRLATEGFFLPQPTGGPLRSVSSYRTDFYCIHALNAWIFSMPVDDLSPTNQIFRENVGLSYHRAAVATGDGIYFVDTSNPDQPKFKLLTLDTQSTQVIPTEFSFNVDLSGYSFTSAVGYRWGEYVIFACATSDSTVNNRMFVFHRQYKSFDLLDYNASCLVDNNGDLWAGESSTDNVTQLFTGFTANGSLITNYWEGKLSEMQIDEIKKFKRFTLRGKIATDQSMTVSLSYDGGEFASIGTISGTGSYVSASASGVGAKMVGSTEVGGGDETPAGDYVREFRVRSPKFERVKVRIEATGTGYASVSEIRQNDIRVYGKRNLTRFRQTA